MAISSYVWVYRTDTNGVISSVSYDYTSSLAGGGSAWGSITGSVSTQTDITTYAAASSHVHSASDITSSTSALALSGMAFTVGALSTYAFKFGVVFATAIATTGYKIGLVYPAASTFAAKVSIPQGAAGPLGEWVGSITASGGTVNTTTVPLASTKYYAEVNGIIHPSSAGTLQLHIGTEIAGSAQSTFAGTFGQLTKITP